MKPKLFEDFSLPPVQANAAFMEELAATAKNYEPLTAQRVKPGRAKKIVLGIGLATAGLTVGYSLVTPASTPVSSCTESATQDNCSAKIDEPNSFTKDSGYTSRYDSFPEASSEGKAGQDVADCVFTLPSIGSYIGCLVENLAK